MEKDLWENIYHGHLIVIHPLKDSDFHDEEGTTCKCEPRIEFVDGGMLVIHNAYDQREIIEQVNNILETKKDQQQ